MRDRPLRMSGAFYRELLTAMDKKRRGDGGSSHEAIGGRIVAEALQRAVVKLRVETQCSPEKWAPFIHLGA